MKPILLPLMVLTFGPGAGWCQDKNPAAELKALEATAKTYVEAFNKSDPAGIARLFLPQGELVLSSGELIAGRAEIEAHYADVLAGEDRYRAALEAGSVRFVTPGVAVEDGTIHLTGPDDEVSSHYYTAVHVKQEDGRWLLASVRDSPGDHAPPSEKLLGLSWLIGDWLIQIEDTETWVSFDWSEHGPYIDARALSEEAGVASTAATMRIGWNPGAQGYVSWAFDASGGFNRSDWTETDDGGFLLRTRGFTADGETNACSQVIALDESRQRFTWTKRDWVIGGELQPDRTLQVVKRPPAPAVSASKD